jgi:hypothetical protein
MKKWITISLVTIVLTGCGTSNSVEPSTTASSPPPSHINPTVKATVNTQQFDFAPTWIPVQLDPKFRENHSITRQNEWPTHGTDVDVQCWVRDGEYLNPATNSLQREWYKIYVPADKVDPAVLSARGGEWGYVEAFWLDLRSSNVKECVR